MPLPDASPRGRRGLRPHRAGRRAPRGRGGGRALVPTGIAIAIPEGYAGFVQPRSGLALRHGVTCLNTPGLIDAGYRDEISVLLVNLDPKAAFEVCARRPHRAARHPARAGRRLARGRRARRLGRGVGGWGSTGRPVSGACRVGRCTIAGSGSASPCSKGRSRKEFTELARKAEALGYSTLFVPDHFVDHDLAPTVALAHAAAVTDALRVGTVRPRQRLQAPRGLRAGDGVARPALRRAARARDRRGLDDRRLREGRHPARPTRRAHRPARGGDHGDEGALRAGAVHLRRRVLPGHRARRYAQARAAARCRSSSVAARRRSWRSRRARPRSSGSTRTCARATATSPDAALSMTPEATDQKIGWVRDAAGDASTTSSSSRWSGSCT